MSFEKAFAFGEDVFKFANSSGIHSFVFFVGYYPKEEFILEEKLRRGDGFDLEFVF